MKKILIIISVLAISGLLFADTSQTHLDQTNYTINTYVPNYCLVTLTPNSAIMPFDITSNLVAYSSSGPTFIIGTWTIESNMSPSTISVSTTPLVCATDNTSLNYILWLYYESYIPDLT